MRRPVNDGMHCSEQSRPSLVVEDNDDCSRGQLAWQRPGFAPRNGSLNKLQFFVFINDHMKICDVREEFLLRHPVVSEGSIQ